MNIYTQEYNGYQIKPHKEFPSSIIIAYAGKGGKIPDILNGLYTSKQLAKNAIDKYLAIKEDHGIQTANKTINKS